jgi:hypothetical protein
MRIPRTTEYIKTNPQFALTSASDPRLQQGQMTLVHESLKPFPTEYSLEGLVPRCIERGYTATIKGHGNAANPVFIRKSVLYHLDRLLNGTAHTTPDLLRIVRGM